MRQLYGYLVTFFGGGASVAIVIIWIFYNLDKIERMAAWFFRTFSWVRKTWEYRNVAVNIQAAVNTVGEVLNKEASGVLPHAMKVEWARTAKDAEAFLRDGNVIVSMEYSSNRARNLVVSTLAYLGGGFLPKARPYVDSTLMRATDFTVAKRVFLSDERSSAMQYFFEHYVEPEALQAPVLRVDCAAFDRMEEAGFFSRIFLKELEHVADSAFPSTPDDATRGEVREFARFLDAIASRPRGEKTELGLSFLRSRIRANVMLVARPGIYGTRIYARRTQINIARGTEYMYICARGRHNILLAKRVAREQETAGQLEILSKPEFESTYHGTQYNAICIACALTLLAPSQAAEDPDSKLYRVLEESIEEIRDGKIEVVELVREPGVGSKVIVRAHTEDLDAQACCAAYANLDTIRTLVADEQLHFIQWFDDPKQLVVASLTPLDPNDVVDVLIDNEKGQAVVMVNGWKPRRVGLGKGDANLRLAMELTGWIIEVEDTTNRDALKETVARTDG